MSLVVGTNTYVDEATADAYFNSRWNSDFWATLDSAQKEKLLVSATRALDTYCNWAGEKTDSDQELEFPRYPDTEIPEKIKVAQCEIAFSIYDSESVINEYEPPLTKLKADVVEFQFADTNRTISTLYSDFTISLLSPYCAAAGDKLLERV